MRSPYISSSNGETTERFAGKSCGYDHLSNLDHITIYFALFNKISRAIYQRVNYHFPNIQFNVNKVTA